jgi:hypothetical protein
MHDNANVLCHRLCASLHLPLMQVLLCHRVDYLTVNPSCGHVSVMDLEKSMSGVSQICSLVPLCNPKPQTSVRMGIDTSMDSNCEDHRQERMYKLVWSLNPQGGWGGWQGGCQGCPK